ncbi:hypothetical protein B0H11DRAFT_2235067 [Mycena galericulata]|nr:hypothetical protein B0H11DRAFT_2235067 [Mycena galericulata]
MHRKNEAIRLTTDEMDEDNSSAEIASGLHEFERLATMLLLGGASISSNSILTSEVIRGLRQSSQSEIFQYGVSEYVPLSQEKLADIHKTAELDADIETRIEAYSSTKLGKRIQTATFGTDPRHIDIDTEATVTVTARPSRRRTYWRVTVTMTSVAK